MFKSIQIWCVFGIVLLFSACNPKVSSTLIQTTPSSEYTGKIVVLGMQQAVPENAQKLGQVKIGDTGFSTNCSYDVVIEKAKAEVRKAGGNCLKITDHKLPSAWGSSCHRIEADILMVNDIEALGNDCAEDTIHTDWDYALIHVYRSKGVGAFISYNLFLGDSLLCRVKYNWKTSIKVKQFGYNSLIAKTEVKKEIPINVEMGKEYYVQCGMSMGAFVGHPTLNLVDNAYGKSEFLALKDTNIADGVTLVLKDGREIKCFIDKEDETYYYITMRSHDQNINTQIAINQVDHINYSNEKN